MELPVLDGPVHRYIESSPACWAKYGLLLAREYSNPDYALARRLAVDTYAVQHPGRPSPQSVQSVAVHLIALHVVLEAGESAERATSIMRRCVEELSFTWLKPPGPRARHNVLHPLAAGSAAAHVQAVHGWALSVWASWAAHHAQVRAWARSAQ